MRRAIWFGLAAASLAWTAAAADLPQGLLLHFSFDDTGGGRYVADKSGHGHAGRAAALRALPAGRLGGAAEFATSGSYVAVSAARALLQTQHTVAVWFRTSGPRDGGQILFAQPATGYHLALDPEGRARLTVGAASCRGKQPLADGAWHHVAATCDGRNLRLYVDGAAQPDPAALSAPLPASTNALLVGAARADAAEPSFGGALDELMLFDHALGDGPVAEVVAAAKPRFTDAEVERTRKQLKELLDRGLILPEFYERKMKECEPGP